MRQDMQIAELSSGASPAVLLGRRLGFEEAPALAALLLGRRGSPLTLDASEVDQLGTSCLQVLLAAAATWRVDGQPFSFVDPSPEVLVTLAHLGLDTGALNSKEWRE